MPDGDEETGGPASHEAMVGKGRDCELAMAFAGAADGAGTSNHNPAARVLLHGAGLSRLMGAWLLVHRRFRGQGENEAMARCRKCGAGKRRWPRSCSRCRSGEDRGEAATDVAELVVETGLLGWIGRGVTAVARLILRVVG